MISYKDVKMDDGYDWNRLSQTARERAAQEVVNSFWIPHARAFRNYQYLSINEKINQKVKGKTLFSERIKILGWIKNPNYFLVVFSLSPPSDGEQDAPVSQDHLKNISSYEYDHGSRKAVGQRHSRV